MTRYSSARGPALAQCLGNQSALHTYAKPVEGYEVILLIRGQLGQMRPDHHLGFELGGRWGLY